MSDLFKDLIDKYKKDQLSDSEKSFLLSSTSSKSVEEAIEVLQHIKDNTDDYKAGTKTNREVAWQRFSKNLSKDFPDKTVHTNLSVQRTLRRALPLMILAGIILVGYLLFTYNHSSNSIQYATLQNKVKAIALTDFSQVKLNGASTLKLDADFNKSSRTLNLEGEAFFDVSHNKEKPFVININLGSITVLGTQFNVNAVTGSDSVTITVKSGKVAFQPINSSTPFVIVANEELTYYKNSSKAIIKQVFGYNAGAWFDKNIKFDATPLSEIVEQLGQLYDVKYVIENQQMRSCKFTGNFNNVDLTEIHSILSKTIPIQIVKTGDRIYKISGKACK